MAIELPDPLSGPSRNRNLKIAGLVVGGLILLGGAAKVITSLLGPTDVGQPAYLQCKQQPFIEPDFESLGLHNTSVFQSARYRKKSVELLAGAVRIPTVSYDDMLFDVDKDPRFDVFYELHDYLAAHFPLLSAHVEKINSYGLLYTIEGSDASLKPVVLMAHQDVVPVAPETAGDWTSPPFSGHFDGEWVHGRGSSDTKNSLIAIHEAVEALLAQRWTPERTLLLSFGFDEEIQGFRGARKLAEHIEKVYGRNGVEMLIDEGTGFTEEYGSFFASPAVAEKGRVNFRVTFKTPGGHSSIPPDHTGIGLASELIVRLEDEVPLKPELLDDLDAVRARFACIGHFADDDLPLQLRNVYTNLGSPAADSQLIHMLASNVTTRIMVETTQAIDLIHGGVKINALPEETVFEVNYRIKPASSVEQETSWFLQQVKGVASDFALGVEFQDTFGGAQEADTVVPPLAAAAGAVLVERTDALDVAPISPFHNSTHWDLLGGTARNVLATLEDDFGASPLVMTPGLMFGNTDTAHYWNLTDKIYRFNFVKMDTDARNIHTVNEALRARSHISCVAFFYEFIINAQRALS